MFKGYNLTVSDEYFSAWVPSARAAHDNSKEEVRKSLNSFFDADGVLSASKISDNWFPQISADVFISHAHADSEEAIGLAGWLESNFGLKAFIDSSVWGYSEKLLRKLDDKYCKSDDGKTYRYETRNKTTSNVHIILSSALHRMIDSTECVIFLNTPQSTSFKGHVTEVATHSPWIFSEIAMTQLIQTRQPQRQQILKSEAALESFRADFKIKHDLSLNHLTSIDESDLKDWVGVAKHGHLKSGQALDALYQLV